MKLPKTSEGGCLPFALFALLLVLSITMVVFTLPDTPAEYAAEAGLKEGVEYPIQAMHAHQAHALTLDTNKVEGVQIFTSIEVSIVAGDTEYTFEIPADKLKFTLDENAAQPTVAFTFADISFNELKKRDMDSVISKYLEGATITLPPELYNELPPS